MASKNPCLIGRWVDKGNRKVAALKEMIANDLQIMQRLIQTAWDDFKGVYPTAARALQGIGRVTSAPFRGIQKLYQNHQVAITIGAKGELVLFLVGW